MNQRATDGTRSPVPKGVENQSTQSYTLLINETHHSTVKLLSPQRDVGRAAAFDYPGKHTAFDMVNPNVNKMHPTGHANAGFNAKHQAYIVSLSDTGNLTCF